jgi:hypothetical protein
MLRLKEGRVERRSDLELLAARLGRELCRRWPSHSAREPRIGCSVADKILPCHGQAEPSIYRAAHHVCIRIILTVVLPPAHRAQRERPRPAQRLVSTTQAAHRGRGRHVLLYEFSRGALVHAVQQLHSLVTLQRYCAVGPVRTCRSLAHFPEPRASHQNSSIPELHRSPENEALAASSGCALRGHFYFAGVESTSFTFQVTDAPGLSVTMPVSMPFHSLPNGSPKLNCSSMAVNGFSFGA